MPSHVTLADITEENFEAFMDMELPEPQRDLLSRGIGRRAMELVLEEIRARPDATRITICYHTRNERAKAFYASFGFSEVGIDELGEMVAEIRLA